MSFEIVHRYTRAVLFSSGTATKMKTALAQAVASGADLRGADLRGADLGGADLGAANLGGADLFGANLGGANLGGADLGGANLRGANLRGADLRGADLRGADLGGADLGGANLRGANLRGAEGMLPDGIPPLQILGSRDYLIVREAGHITIGCEHHPVKWWEENYVATGVKNRYSAAEISEYRAHIQHAKQWMELKGVLAAPVPAAEEAVS